MSELGKKPKIQVGQEGEDLAASHLKSLGYEILQRNFRTKLGELDCIVQKGERIFFVEVKRRRNRSFGKAIEAVSVTKQRKIRRLAECFLLTMPAYRNLVPYFSVLAIDDHQGSVQIEFIPNAF